MTPVAWCDLLAEVHRPGATAPGIGGGLSEEWSLMDAGEARAIGFALWRVRDARGKSLRVVAGLTGMSKDTLNRIERGLLSPTLAQLHALAEVLQISPRDLTRLPVPAPANGETDAAIKAVRRAAR